MVFVLIAILFLLFIIGVITGNIGYYGGGSNNSYPSYPTQEPLYSTACKNPSIEYTTACKNPMRAYTIPTNWNPCITKEEFEKHYIDNSSRLTPENYRKNRITLPCGCKKGDCSGWSAVRRNAKLIKLYVLDDMPKGAEEYVKYLALTEGIEIPESIFEERRIQDAQEMYPNPESYSD